MRILIKDTAVEKEFDLLEQYKDRVLVGLTLTAAKDKSGIMAEVEPNASLNVDRMKVLRQEHERGLWTYGMLCPLLPAIADSLEQIDELVGLALGRSEHTAGH